MNRKPEHQINTWTKSMTAKRYPSLPDLSVLLKIARTPMPFGRYKDLPLVDLPEPYVVWFAQKGFPEGELGEMLRMVHEIKVNGLEYLFEPLK